MEQNTIAVIWDFDKTLIPGYMQEPIFKAYDIDGKKFWDETNKLVDIYKEQGIKVNKDTIYLNHMLTCVQQGVFKGSIMRSLGSMEKSYSFTREFLRFLKH